MITEDLDDLMATLVRIRFAPDRDTLDRERHRFVGALMTLHRLGRLTDDDFNRFYELHENCDWYSYARTRHPRDWGSICLPHWRPWG